MRAVWPGSGVISNQKLLPVGWAAAFTQKGGKIAWKTNRDCSAIDYERIGLRIRKARKEAHKTQEQLAEDTGISVSFLGHIERGARKMSLETFSR